MFSFLRPQLIALFAILMTASSCTLHVTYRRALRALASSGPGITSEPLGFYFSRPFVTINEGTGLLVGDEIEVRRPAADAGVAATVDVRIQQVTARIGSDFDIAGGVVPVVAGGTLTVAFGSGVESVQVPLSDLADVHALGADEGDTYFTLKLRNPSAGAVDPFAGRAQVNIVDAATPGVYQFGTTLYTVRDGAGSLDVVVQKTAVTGGAESVTVELVDVTAVRPGHYGAGSATMTANFGTGISEQTLSIPIQNVPAHRSFYLVIRPTNSISVRSQSITKVRILDDDSIHLEGATLGVSKDCDPTEPLYGAGAGTAPDPYQICSPTQLADGLSASPSAHFLIAADLDMDPLENIIGAIPVLFDGSIDGGEYALFSNVQSGASPQALFTTIGSAGISPAFRNLHLHGFSHSGTNASLWAIQSHLLSAPTFTNMFASGYLSCTVRCGGWMAYAPVGGVTLAITFEKSLLSGTVRGGTAGNGGFVGQFTPSAIGTSLSLNRSYNLANSLSDGNQNVGGGVGYASGVGAVEKTLIFLDFQSRGRVRGGVNSGGLLGGTQSANNDFNLQITSSINTGVVDTLDSASAFGDIYHGGLVGFVAGWSVEITGSANYGQIKMPAGFAGTRIGNGGIAGGIELNSTAPNTSSVTLTSNESYGDLVAAGENSGGIVGSIVLSGLVTANGITAEVTDSVVELDITGEKDFTGGIAGRILVTTLNTAAGATSVDVSRNQYTGTISCPTALWAAGVTAQISTAAGHVDTVVSQNTVVGNVSSLVGAFGTAGLVYLQEAQTLAFQNNSFSGALASAASHVAGIVGAIVNGGDIDGADIQITDNNTSGTGVGTDTSVGGIVGEVALTGGANAFINSNIEINDNVNDMDLTGTTYLGGIVGNYFSAVASPGGTGGNTILISGNTNTGALVSSGVSGRTGGIVGGFDLASGGAQFDLVSNRNSGTINATSPRTGGIVGGIAAGAGSGHDFEIYRSTNDSNGAITGTTSVGGILGEVTMDGATGGSIRECHNDGAIVATSASGGLVGQVLSTAILSVTDSVFSGTALGENGTFTLSAPGATSGGLVGTTTGSCTINSSLMTVDIPVGITPLGQCPIIDSFWLRDAPHNLGFVVDTENRDFTYLTGSGFPGSWDFTTIWTPAVLSTQFPTLRNAR